MYVLFIEIAGQLKKTRKQNDRIYILIAGQIKKTTKRPDQLPKFDCNLSKLIFMLFIFNIRY